MNGWTFQLLVVSPEDLFPEEASWLNKLFEAGLSNFHLRKPGWSFRQLLHFARQIDACFHSRMMVHYEERLLQEVAFRGVHYRVPALPAIKPGFCVSGGLHNWQEFQQLESRLDYALLSPFFSSISKKGYAANSRLWQIPAGAQQRKVYALGGIKAGNLKSVYSLGFGGAAVLGAIWERGNPLQAYGELMEEVQILENECPKKDLL